MTEPDNPAAAGPRVGVYALIGREDCLLLLTDQEGRVCALPGGAVRAGEPVEQALRRTLRDQLGVTIAALDFSVVVEYPIAEPGHQPTSEVALLFDVTLTNSEPLNESSAQRHRWAEENEWAAVRPDALGNALVTGALADTPWLAWTP
jgi:8-oxo-dGTP diphosphatase